MWAPLTIFIGGFILDRGLTIPNLIGFYYGRRPSRFQQDTVLQHSRMYGNRPLEDLSVTRFYTTPRIYSVLNTIYEFDKALREDTEKPHEDSGVYFIQKDTSNRIIPCSPNKILLSSVTTLEARARLLPFGFQIKKSKDIKGTVSEIDGLIDQVINKAAKSEPFKLPLAAALDVVDKISKTFDKRTSDRVWDVEAFKVAMEYLSENSKNLDERGFIWCLVRTGREASRVRKTDRQFMDAPETQHEEGKVARDIAVDIPCLILLRQKGKRDLGWAGGPFWWPVLRLPSNMSTVVFAKDIEELSQE